MIFWKKAAELKRRAEFLASQTFVVLSIHVPKDNEKNAQFAEQFFSSVHGIYRDDPVLQEHLGLEIVASRDSIIFYIFTPLHLKDFIEGQLYAQYPDLNIKQVTDYTQAADLAGMHVVATDIKLTKEDVYPIKTYATSDVDPLASITAVMSNLEEREQLWLQIVVRPVGDEWQNKGVAVVQAVRSGKKSSAATGILKGASAVVKVVGMIVQEAVRPGGSMDGGAAAPSEVPKLSAPQEAALKGIESKITKLGFECVFRLTSIAANENLAQARALSLLSALKQFNTTNLNGFKAGDSKVDDYAAWEKYINREFEGKGSILNTEELASVFHFPNISVETNAIARAGSKKGEAPFNTPLLDQLSSEEITVIGKTDFRSKAETFGIKMDDRKRHIYVIGKSGTGKSTLLENMVIDDIFAGRGVIVVDPHGEFADKIVDSIPENRIQDCIVLDPADREWPIAFNLLEQVGDDFKGMVASGFVGIFKKIFGHSWGPRLEYILRNTVLALLDSPNSTMLGIPRMLTERAFRDRIVENITDPVIRDFWTHEWAGMDQKQQSEALGPILNKVGQFLSTSTIRNIVGQPKSTIDIRKIMDEKKILIVNLSKGKIGEDNMALLGAMIVTKVQLAAMSRANVAVSERPDCYLYVDEFQNFATDSFATILSEARKYNLGLTIAHQYIAQLSEEVRDAVIGNVGSMILFRVGAPDAEALQKEFAPVFEVADMLNLEKAHIYVKLLVNGLAAQPFSAITLPPKAVERSYREEVLNYSRAHYSRPRTEVEALIDDTAGYKQKREAQEASKFAAQILQQPSTVPSAQRLPQPALQALAVPQSVPLAEAVVPASKQSNSDQGMGEQQEKKPIKEKLPKIVDGTVYREVSQKGGLKWYLGEPEEVYKARKAQKEAEKATAQIGEESPPSPTSPSEQKPIDNTQYAVQSSVSTSAVEQLHATRGSVVLEEGGKIQF